MIRNLSPIQLGGSLYIPATHKNVSAVCNEHKFSQLRSCIIDTEDAIDEQDLDEAISNIGEMLENYEPKELCVFIRPRNPQVLKKLLKLPNIGLIDGFALPKFSTKLMKEYAQIFTLCDKEFYTMPVLESLEIFSKDRLEEMCSFLLSSNLHVLSLRLGGEDMMNYLGLKRKCKDNIYELVGPARVIGDVINIFKPYGFNVSATVFNCIHQPELYAQNLAEDLRQGLLGKTIIHPNQIEPINQAYKVSQEDYEMAKQMLDSNTSAIIVNNGQMGEKSAHSSWARIILERHKFYGLKTSRN
ncbi:HpcH/HpaI aldolase/citrate lyase family protein [Sulfurimonas sp. MAG313]|nr:HpcH/HpaI aldolase/citrate lyase family protein [Sulfurimonas sp. MAG313]MDF1881178.1 HpcH/HpaI aldolase/citrate lyase family protein [Sulfurimonas sp. MAG313]